MLDGTSGSGNVDSLAEMCATMEEIRRQNQTLEDNILNIWQHQQETNPP